MTWRTLEGGYARVRFWVGLVLGTVLFIVAACAVAFLFWVWRLSR